MGLFSVQGYSQREEARTAPGGEAYLHGEVCAAHADLSLALCILKMQEGIAEIPCILRLENLCYLDSRFSIAPNSRLVWALVGTSWR